MERCDKCKFWERSYNDNGYLRYGKCLIKLPSYIKTSGLAETREDEGCSLGQPIKESKED